jgi:N-hydroxyarylamine O-acetyltransferase
VDVYRSRIRYAGSIAPNAQTLFALQRAHLLSVPFENLDIHLGRPIQLEVDVLFSKLIAQMRGGFCYELNGLFACLLESLGYRVNLMNARSLEDDGSYGPEYDHLALQVRCPDDSTPWLVDVGWGNGPFEPLNLSHNGVQRLGDREFQVQPAGEYLELAERLEENGRWIKHYAFTMQPHILQDFSACCQFHQTSPNSIFTRKRICSIFLEDGHITLSDSPGGRRLITTRSGTREERPIRGEAEFRRVLRDVFGIDVQI